MKSNLSYSSLFCILVALVVCLIAIFWPLIGHADITASPRAQTRDLNAGVKCRNCVLGKGKDGWSGFMDHAMQKSCKILMYTVPGFWVWQRKQWKINESTLINNEMNVFPKTSLPGISLGFIKEYLFYKFMATPAVEK